MKAEIIAIGTELLQPGRHESNGDWLAARLAEVGIELGRRSILADDEEEIAEVLTASRTRSSVVVVTGGLGPTKDDVTREALARSLGASLEVDPSIYQRIHAAYSARGLPAEGAARTQARIPEGCIAIENPVGSAPGILHPGPPCWTILLPGVPREMESMFAPALLHLAGVMPSRAAPRIRLLVGGLAESEVDERVRHLIGAHDRAKVTILAGEAGVELLIIGTGDDHASALVEVERIAGEARPRLGAFLLGEGDTTPARVVGDLLRAAGGTLAVAESCTGGLVGAKLTEVPGASEWFAGGFIVYSDVLKEALLDVPRALLKAHGAVSEEVAQAMAEGARRRAGASHAVAITGIAGPGGGTEAKPVGLVWFAIASDAGTSAKSVLLRGDRHSIRSRAATIALELVRRRLIGDRS